MYAVMLRAQWRTTRVLIAALTVVAFGAPLATVFYGANLATASSYTVGSWLSAATSIGSAIPVIALLTGVLLGMAVWSADQLGGHVYALSLPLPRWRYVLLRFAVGATFVAAPVAAATAGALIAASAVQLPEGLHAYPLPLALRFATATLVCYAIFFALSTATKRLALVLLGTLGGLVLGDLLLAALGKDAVVVVTGFRLLTTWPGPLAILMGRWALFDV
jgi:hypothetical protein